MIRERRVVPEEVRRVFLQVPLDAARAAEAARAREARAVVEVAFEVLQQPVRAVVRLEVRSKSVFFGAALRRVRRTRPTNWQTV